MTNDTTEINTAYDTRLVHWLADMHSGGFAPAFTFSLCESEAPVSPKARPNPHCLDRYFHSKNQNVCKDYFLS